MLIVTLVVPLTLLAVLPYMDRLERWVSTALLGDRAQDLGPSSLDVEDPS